MILGLLKPHKNIERICEFGGGDSCFYTSFREVYKNAFYCVLDNSTNGVKSFNDKFRAPQKQEANLCNLLEAKLDSKFDLVFSAGLIEHFNRANTAKMIRQHFSATKSGGIVLITYPTPTLLYRIIRHCSEKMGLWIFFDERPLLFDEVDLVAREYGKLLAKRLNVAIGLTQEIVVYKKY